MLYDLAMTFHELGIEVLVVAACNREASAFDRCCPFPIIRYRNWPKPFFLLSILFAYRRACRRAIDSRAIVSGWFPSGLALALLPRWLRASYSVLTYGMELHVGMNGWRRMLLRYVYRGSSGAMPISHYTAQLMQEVGVEVASTVVPPGIRSSSILPQRAEVPTILSVGRLVERKGFDVMLEAVAVLIPTFPNLRYEILGEGPQEQNLRDQVRRLGLDEHVCFYGKVSSDELREAYARAWCFALPARRIGGDVEGFGIVYLEAAMAELPTIGGRDSGANDAIEDGKSGILVDGQNVHEVEAALNILLGDRAYAQGLGCYGKRRAETDFAWRNIAEKMLRVFTL